MHWCVSQVKSAVAMFYTLALLQCTTKLCSFWLTESQVWTSEQLNVFQLHTQCFSTQFWHPVWSGFQCDAQNPHKNLPVALWNMLMILLSGSSCAPTPKGDQSEENFCLPCDEFFGHEQGQNTSSWQSKHWQTFWANKVPRKCGCQRDWVTQKRKEALAWSTVPHETSCRLTSFRFDPLLETTMMRENDDGDDSFTNLKENELSGYHLITLPPQLTYYSIAFLVLSSQPRRFTKPSKSRLQAILLLALPFSPALLSCLGYHFHYHIRTWFPQPWTDWRVDEAPVSTKSDNNKSRRSERPGHSLFRIPFCPFPWRLS